MVSVKRGFRCKVEEHLNVSKDILVELFVDGDGVYDSCCFGLDASGKLGDDSYMVFFNQTRSPGGEIVQNSQGAVSSFTVGLGRLPSKIDRLAFTVSVDGAGAMGSVRRFAASLADASGGPRRLFPSGGAALSMELAGSDFASEKAVIALEMYRKGGWRLAAVGQGFNGGLPALLRHYGGEEAASPAPAAPAAPAPAAPAQPSRPSLEKRLQSKAPELVSLAKPLRVALEKNRLADTVAKVGLVLDISGSMSSSYECGKVQKVIDKTVPLAVQFDDDGELDLWYYGSRCKRMDAVKLDNYKKAVPKGWSSLMAKLGYGNNEPAVMMEVIDEYSRSRIPAYVIFITDGGIDMESEIKKLLINASRKPIFWQFVGFGGQGYGVLERLDTMGGRFVDNANFFALDDFETVSNEALYDRLLGEFPHWLKAAKEKGILE
jgi:stress response protein SCP2